MAVDLCGLQYGYSSKQQIQLESKDDLKKRGLASPDLGDCLAMTFSVTVQPKKQYEMDPETLNYLRRVCHGGGV